MSILAWLRRPCVDGSKRGTLTLLPEGRIVLGTPDETNAQRAHDAAMAIRDWLATPDNLLVVPFPIDVIDKRSRLRIPDADKRPVYPTGADDV